MSPEDRIRLGHMLEAVRDAQGFMLGRKRADLDADKIHAYSSVTLDIVWKTVTEDLPPLADSLESALAAQ